MFLLQKIRFYRDDKPNIVWFRRVRRFNDKRGSIRFISEKNLRDQTELYN